MLYFEKKSRISCSALHLYQWHMEPGAFETLTPPWENVSIIKRPDHLEEGAKVVLINRMGPVKLTWVALHQNFVEGRRFDDVQETGPFKHWHHSHLFEPITEHSCIMQDKIAYQLPGGSMINRLAAPFVHRRLVKMFDYRHQQLISNFGEAVSDPETVNTQF